MFQVTIAFTLRVFAGCLVNNDVLRRDAELRQSLDLPVGILRTGRYPCVTVCSILHESSFLCQKVVARYGMFQNEKTDFSTHYFGCFSGVPQPILYGT